MKIYPDNVPNILWNEMTQGNIIEDSIAKTLRGSLKFSNSSTEEQFRFKILCEMQESYSLGLSLNQRVHLCASLYLSLLLLYELFFIFNYLVNSIPGNILLTQSLLILSLSVVFVVLTVVFFKTNAVSKHRNAKLMVSYIIVYIGTIFCSYRVQFSMHGEGPDMHFSMLPILILFSHSSKFVYFARNRPFVLVHCGLAVFYGFLHYSNVLEALFEVALLLGSGYFTGVYFYYSEVVARSDFLKTTDSSAEDSSDIVTNIEGVSLCLTESADLICAVIPTLRKPLKSRAEKLHAALRKSIQALSSKNIYDANIDQITKHMDQEDRIFIQETSNVPKKVNLPVERRLKTKKTMEIKNFEEFRLQEYIGVLRHIGKNWNFDMFFLENLSEGRTLQLVGDYFVEKYGIAENLNIPTRKVTSFFMYLEAKYLENPYHNSVHAADVLSNFLYILNQSAASQCLVDLEILSIIIANLGHDVGHPGLNNRYLINSESSLSVEYNDIAVLEMMHCTTIFKIIRSGPGAMLENFDSQSYSSVRKMVIEMVLATDMSKHFEMIGRFKAKSLQHPSFDLPEERMDLFKFIIKAADVGHAAKRRELHEKWSILVIEEFFKQGDLEKAQGLQVSMFCDRDTTDVGKSQAGFIRNIVLPLYEALNALLQSHEIEKNCIEQLKLNIASWGSFALKTKSQIFEDSMIHMDLRNLSQYDK